MEIRSKKIFYSKNKKREKQCREHNIQYKLEELDWEICNNGNLSDNILNEYDNLKTELKEKEALKGFTTGPLVTSQTQTSPRFSRLHFRLFQVHPNFQILNPRDKKRYYATQYFNFSVTLLRYGLKILTDSWIEGDSLGYPNHPPRRCHSGRQPTFIHFFTNTLKCLHGRLAG